MTPAPIDVAALRRLLDRADDDNLADYEPAQKSLDALLRAVEERDALLAACDAKNALLACYRIGKSPSDALQKRLDKANEAIRRAKEPQ